MKTKISYAVFDSKATEEIGDYTCLYVADTLKEAEEEALDYGEGNCIWKLTSEVNPKIKKGYLLMKEKFIKQVFSKTIK